MKPAADGANAQVAATALTDERGEYEFIGLKPGRYRVRCQTPDGPVYYRTSDGTLWLGGEGLWKYDGQTLTKVADVPQIRKLDADAHGNIWFGTLGGAWRYNPTTGEKRRFTVEDGLPHNNVTGIRRGPGDSVWIGSYDGLVQFDGKQIVDFRDLRARKSQPAVWTIHQDPQGGVWFGGSFVFGRFEGRECSWPGEQTEAGKARIGDLVQSSDGILWLSTENHGFLGFDPKTQVATAIDPRDGLAGKNVSAVAADARGQLWVATRDGGLTRFRRGKEYPSAGHRPRP